MNNGPSSLPVDLLRACHCHTVTLSQCQCHIVTVTLSLSLCLFADASKTGTLGRKSRRNLPRSEKQRRSSAKTNSDYRRKTYSGNVNCMSNVNSSNVSVVGDDSSLV